MTIYSMNIEDCNSLIVLLQTANVHRVFPSTAFEILKYLLHSLGSQFNLHAMRLSRLTLDLLIPLDYIVCEIVDLSAENYRTHFSSMSVEIQLLPDMYLKHVFDLSTLHKVTQGTLLQIAVNLIETILTCAKMYMDEHPSSTIMHQIDSVSRIMTGIMTVLLPIIPLQPNSITTRIEVEVLDQKCEYEYLA
jgi:hypothetical protein